MSPASTQGSAGLARFAPSEAAPSFLNPEAHYTFSPRYGAGQAARPNSQAEPSDAPNWKVTRTPVRKAWGRYSEGPGPTTVPIRRVARGVSRAEAGAFRKNAAGAARIEQAQQRALKRERSFNLANYHPGDRDFWKRYDEIWYKALDLDLTPDELDIARDVTQEPAQGKPVRNVRPTFRGYRDPMWQRHRLLQGHIQGSTDAKQALKKYQFWKNKIRKAWRRTGGIYASGQQAPSANARELRQLLKLETLTALRKAWQAKSLDKRATVWPHLMVAAFRYYPETIPLLVQATFEEEVSPFYVIEDSLHVLLRRTERLPERQRSAAISTLAETLLFLLRHSSPRYLQLRQNLLFKLFKGWDDIEGKAELAKELGKYGHPLHPFALLHIGNSLAGDVRYKAQVLDLIRSLTESRLLDLNQPHGAALCNKLLSMKEGEPVPDDPALTTAKLFETLMGLGLKANFIIYTTLIRNLCLSGQFGSACDVYNMMLEHKVAPDAWTDSVLLNGAKAHGEWDMVERIISKASEEQVRDPAIWNDFLHTIYFSVMNEAKNRPHQHYEFSNIPAFPIMLRAYAKLFKLEPLQSLVMTNLSKMLDHAAENPEGSARWRFVSRFDHLVAGLPNWNPEECLHPDATTIGVMLIAYVKGFSDSYSILLFYARFRKLLRTGNCMAERLVRERGTLVHDTIIKAVTEWKGMQRVAVDIVGDMLKDKVAALARDGDDPERTRLHPAPSIYTWSILLHSFMQHRQPEQGERILDVMRYHGVQPTVVTWNTLVAGYARMQHITETVGAIQRMEAAGLRLDKWTKRAFSYLTDRATALEMMENHDKMAQHAQPTQQLDCNGEDSSLERQLQEMEQAVDAISEDMGGNPNQPGLYEEFGWDG